MTAPRFLTLSDVADELQVSLSQVRALVRSGELPAIQIGGRNQWRIEPALRLISLLAAGNHSTYKGRRDNPYALLCTPPRV